MKLYVVAQVDYEEYSIIGIYTGLNQAKRIRAKFNKLIREEWHSQAHLWCRHKRTAKRYDGTPSSRCIITVHEANDPAIRREEEFLRNIKYHKTHIMRAWKK